LNTEFVIRLRFAFKMLILTAAGLQIRQDGDFASVKAISHTTFTRLVGIW